MIEITKMFSNGMVHNIISKCAIPTGLSNEIELCMQSFFLFCSLPRLFEAVFHIDFSIK